jgi:hypothetical protein
MRRIPFAVAVAAASLTFAATASAQRTSGFGEKGTLSINASAGSPILDVGAATPSRLGLTPLLGLQFDNTQATVNNATTTDHSTAFYLVPALDYFVIDHLSIGGEIGFAHIDSSNDVNVGGTTRSTSNPGIDLFGLQARVGYNIDITRQFSIWPRGGLGFRYVSNPDAAANTTANEFFLNVDVPILWHPVDHFFIGVAPSFNVALSGTYSVKDTNTNVSTNTGFGRWSLHVLNAVLGGWF